MRWVRLLSSNGIGGKWDHVTVLWKRNQLGLSSDWLCMFGVKDMKCQCMLSCSFKLNRNEGGFMGKVMMFGFQQCYVTPT